MRKRRLRSAMALLWNKVTPTVTTCREKGGVDVKNRSMTVLFSYKLIYTHTPLTLCLKYSANIIDKTTRRGNAKNHMQQPCTEINVTSTCNHNNLTLYTCLPLPSNQSFYKLIARNWMGGGDHVVLRDQQTT